MCILYVGLSSTHIHIWITIIFIHFVKFHHLVLYRWKEVKSFMDEIHHWLPIFMDEISFCGRMKKRVHG